MLDIIQMKKLIIKALFADDELVEIFVLKGGSALDLVYKINDRTSVDIDISLEEDFRDFDKNRETIESKLVRAFDKVFDLSDYVAFDFKFTKRPLRMSEEKEFWGGYRLEFKIIEKEKYKKDDLELTRKTALSLGKDEKKTFKIDFSRFEFCGGKQEASFEDFYIYVYSPLMIVNEKIRALCQQTEEYCNIINSHQRTPRARDFFDIHAVFKSAMVNDAVFYSDKNKDIIKQIFSLKKVPLHLIGQIKDSYDYHIQDYPTLEATVSSLKPFDYYFKFVVDKVKGLESLWVE